MKKVPAVFFKTTNGNEPVRAFFRSLSDEDRGVIGRAVSEVEFGWPIGMPLTKALGGGLHELRTRLSGARQCRVFFFVSAQEKMVLLHAMIKKTQKANAADLDLAKARMAAFSRAL